MTNVPQKGPLVGQGLSVYVFTIIVNIPFLTSWIRPTGMTIIAA